MINEAKKSGYIVIGIKIEKIDRQYILNKNLFNVIQVKTF